MKTIRTFLSLLVFSSMADAAAPTVGSISENQSFARKSGAGFSAASLDDYEGSILILMMMTPWCPICQSHAQAVGTGLLDYFDNPLGGSLRGKNDNGVPIQSILLSTEQAASWDSVNESFSTTNGFKQWGLDADAQRLNPRQLLGYYRGGFISSPNLYDWGNDRRRVVVLNLVKGSKSHAFREIIINQNSYSAGNNAVARAAINAVLPQSDGQTPQPDTTPSQMDSTPPKADTTPPQTDRKPPRSDAKPPQADTKSPPTGDDRAGTPDDPPIAPSNGQSAPEIDVQQPRKTSLADGKARRSFGTAKVRQNGRSLVFRITNTGNATLTNLSIEKAGKNPGDFIVRVPDRVSIAPGTSATFNVTFKPLGSGTRRAALQVRSNDADESRFDIALTGLGAR